MRLVCSYDQCLDIRCSRMTMDSHQLVLGYEPTSAQEEKWHITTHMLKPHDDLKLRCILIIHEFAALTLNQVIRSMIGYQKKAEIERSEKE